MSITEVATTMRTRFDGDGGWKRTTWRLGVVLFLPAKKHLQVFNPGKHDDDERTNDANHKHAFENSHHARRADQDQTHKRDYGI